MKSILIAFSDYNVSDFLCKSIGYLGYETIPIYRQDEVVSSFSGRSLKLGLIDLEMENAQMWVKEIKRVQPQVQLIGLVNKLDDKKVPDKFGVDSLLSKPFDADDILRTRMRAPRRTP